MLAPLARGFAAEEWPADVEYLDQTAWPPDAEPARSQQRMHGVAIARVPRCHPSHPGAGLYATRRWEACEVLGEYTGRVAGPEREGAYVLALEPDVPPADSLSVDAETAGKLRAAQSDSLTQCTVPTRAVEQRHRCCRDPNPPTRRH